MKSARLSENRRLFCAAVLAIAISVPGCAVTLLSSYDETTDKSVTALQRKTEAHLVALESVDGLPGCELAKHKQYYSEAKVDVSAVAVRAAAIPKNERTTEQITLLAGSLEDLEKLHRISCFSKAQIAPLRILLNSQFTSILKLELAKKRGE